MKSGNEFVQVGSRLNSYIQFRNLPDELRPVNEAYCIADATALVYRADYSKQEGMVDTYAPDVAQRYLAKFDKLWQAS